jgi:hypothetical protein
VPSDGRMAAHPPVGRKIGAEHGPRRRVRAARDPRIEMGGPKAVRGAPGRATLDRGMPVRAVAARAMSGRGMPVRAVAARAMSGRGMPVRAVAARAMSGRATAARVEIVKPSSPGP